MVSVGDKISISKKKDGGYVGITSGTPSVGNKIGNNEFGWKSGTPAIGDKLITNSDVHGRIMGRKSGTGAAGTCWTVIDTLTADLPVSSSDIHTFYTNNNIYRYEYNAYSGLFGDAFTNTVTINPKAWCTYCLGTVTGTTMAASFKVPNQCDVYLLINDEVKDYILYNEYNVSASQTKKFSSINTYTPIIENNPVNVKLYLRPYDGLTPATTVNISVFEMSYAACANTTRQTEGYFVTDLWKVHDEVPEYLVTPIYETDVYTAPIKTDIYNTTFTAREGCIYTLMDFWQYSNVTDKPFAPLTSSYGFQWTYPWAYVGNQEGTTLYVRLNGVGIISRGYGPGAYQAWTGAYDNMDRLTADRGLVIGENTVTVEYPYYYSRHVTYGGSSWYDYNYWSNSALYIVELQQTRI